jgi:CO/xanthine dehydrogenase FAD-binding subunit
LKVLQPETLAEACRQLAEAGGEAVPMAGGTDLLVDWHHRFAAHDKTYLDLSGIPALKAHRWTEDELILGALTTYWDVLRDPRATRELPLLRAAARQVGSVQIQTRGTWAGNIVNASPAADGVPVLMAYDAVVDLRSASGLESLPLAELYLGYKQLRRRPDQLIEAIRLPRRRHGVEIFEKVGSRRAQAITKVGVAAAHSAAGWRVVANSVAPTVCRCPRLEALLEEGGAVRGPQDLLPALEGDIAPIDDLRSTADYRRTVLSRVLYFALREHVPAWQG